MYIKVSAISLIAYRGWYRVSQRPLQLLLSSFTRRDLAQRTVELLQRELDNVKAHNDIRYQQAPILPTMIQLTGEPEQQLWDLGVRINPSVNKRVLGAIQLPAKEVDWIIEKVREHPFFQTRFSGVDLSQICSVRLLLNEISIPFWLYSSCFDELGTDWPQRSWTV